ncbi:TPA: hypothetical protein OQU49_004415 [Shigella flexneri]|nr:hypothetical protein [Shigella flexneri]
MSATDEGGQAWVPCPCTDQVAQEHHTCTYCNDHLGHWIVEPTTTTH